MKKFKKVLAAVLAGTMVLGALATTAFAAQKTDGLADGTAYLNLNNSDWKDFDAEWKNAEIKGNGDYTVSMTTKEAQNLGDFNALEVTNGESKFGSTYVITVKSIKINGEEAKIADGYTCSADGKGVITRVNLYNKYNNPDKDAVAGDDKHIDNRAADGDVMSKTANMVDSSKLKGVTSVEVSFTVSGLGDTGAGDTSATTALVLVAVAALAVVATVSVKKLAVER